MSKHTMRVLPPPNMPQNPLLRREFSSNIVNDERKRQQFENEHKEFSNINWNYKDEYGVTRNVALELLGDENSPLYQENLKNLKNIARLLSTKNICIKNTFAELTSILNKKIGIEKTILALNLLIDNQKIDAQQKNCGLLKIVSAFKKLQIATTNIDLSKSICNLYEFIKKDNFINFVNENVNKISENVLCGIFKHSSYVTHVLDILDNINCDAKIKNSIKLGFLFCLGVKNQDLDISNEGQSFKDKTSMLEILPWGIPYKENVIIQHLAKKIRFSPLVAAKMLVELANNDIYKEKNIEAINTSEIINKYNAINYDKYYLLEKEFRSNNMSNLKAMQLVNALHEKMAINELSLEDGIKIYEIIKNEPIDLGIKLGLSLVNRHNHIPFNSASACLEHVFDTFSIDKHAKLYKILLSFEEKGDSSQLKELRLSENVSLSFKDIQNIKDVLNAVTDKLENENIAVYISELIINNIQGKNSNLKHVLQYLAALSINNESSELKEKILPIIVSDLRFGQNFAFFNNAINKPNQMIDDYVTYVSKLDEIQDINKGKIISILNYFENDKINMLEVKLNLINFIKQNESYATNILDNIDKLLQDASKNNEMLNTLTFASSLIYEIARPYAISQIGPTCEATSFEFDLCKYHPQEYVKFMVDFWKDIAKYGENQHPLLNTIVSKKEATPQSHLSMNLFQTYYYNRRESLKKVEAKQLEAIIGDFKELYENLWQNSYANKIARNATNAIKLTKIESEKSISQIEKYLSEGKRVFISYNKDIVSGAHAAVIYDAVYDKDKELKGFLIYHGWSTGAKNGSLEYINKDTLALSNVIIMALPKETNKEKI